MRRTGDSTAGEGRRRLKRGDLLPHLRKHRRRRGSAASYRDLRHPRSQDIPLPFCPGGRRM